MGPHIQRVHRRTAPGNHGASHSAFPDPLGRWAQGHGPGNLLNQRCLRPRPGRRWAQPAPHPSAGLQPLSLGSGTLGALEPCGGSPKVCPLLVVAGLVSEQKGQGERLKKDGAAPLAGQFYKSVKRSRAGSRAGEGELCGGLWG